jgi:deoxyribonuclease-4
VPTPSTTAPHRIGIHTTDSGGIDMAVRRAAGAGATALQIFSAIPKFYGDKSNISPDRVARFKTALAATAIEPAFVMVHGAYVLNVATEDPGIWSRAAAGLVKELERSKALGIGMVCFHPGSAKGGDRKAAAARVAKAVGGALAAVPDSPRLLIENTAGAGQTLGRTAEEVAWMLAELPPELRARRRCGRRSTSSRRRPARRRRSSTSTTARARSARTATGTC